jgi:adenosylhomocysteine nucleosidase
VLTAVDLEARSLARQLSLAPVGDGAWPHYRSGALEIVGVGLGAAYLDDRVRTVRRPDFVVSAGACGALAPTLKTADLVIPEAVVTDDGARHATDALAGLERSGLLLSSRTLADTPAVKARLWMQTGALAADMESAAIIAWARARGLPVAVIRAVSDTAEQAVPADLAALVEPGGRVRTTSALRAALRRPGVVTDAVMLKRGVDHALRAVAAALARVARNA